MLLWTRIYSYVEKKKKMWQLQWQSWTSLCFAPQFSSITQLCPTLCDPRDCSMPGLPVHHKLPEFTQNHIYWVGDAIQPSHPLSSPLSVPSIVPSIRVFYNESVLHLRWPKYWSFSLSISSSNEYSGLISFIYRGYFYSSNFSESSVFDCVSDKTMQLFVLLPNFLSNYVFTYFVHMFYK